METTTRTTIKFQRFIGTDEETGDAIVETADVEALVDGESIAFELPAAGLWACDQSELRVAIAR